MTEAASTARLADDVVVSVRDLEVEFPTTLGLVRALNGVSFDVRRGGVLGIVGESGCGKSVTARAILQIVGRPGRIVGGEILYRPRDGGTGGQGGRPAPGRPWGRRQAPVGTGARSGDGVVDLAALDPRGPDIRAIRGREISMIFQEPMTSLNPVYTVGDQIREAVLQHQTADKQEARKRAVEMLGRVGMPNPDRVAASHPHQLSGGMRQRAMIAMALTCTPALLIADEPTTALDVTTEAQILDLMRELRDDLGMSMMLITHSMGVVAQVCDEVAVMYLGRVVERAPVEELFTAPKHPYTISLLRSLPRIGTGRHNRLEVISGAVPEPYTTISGCPFHPRCPNAMPGLCDTVVPQETTAEGRPDHTVRCHLYPGSTPAGVAAAPTRPAAEPAAGVGQPDAE